MPAGSLARKTAAHANDGCEPIMLPTIQTYNVIRLESSNTRLAMSRLLLYTRAQCAWDFEPSEKCFCSVRLLSRRLPCSLTIAMHSAAAPTSFGNTATTSFTVSLWTNVLALPPSG